MKKLFIFPIFTMLLLSACSKSPTAQFYLLPAPQAIAQGMNLTTLAVQKPILPEYLQRAPMVLRANNSAQVEIAEYHRWAEELSTAFQRVLCHALDNALLDKNIDAVPARIGLVSPYKLNIFVNNFEGDINKSASIDLVWSIEAKNRTILKGVYKETLETKGGYDELVNTQAKLIENLALSIANEYKANL